MIVEAAKQALGTLERYAPQHGNPDDMSEAITALRTAIEQAEKQEPVAHLIEYGNGEKELRFQPNGWGDKVTPLYTPPPAAQPAAPDFQVFKAWANDAGYDTAHTHDGIKWVCPNPMTADLWKAWQAAHTASPAAQPAPVQEPVAWDVFELRLYGAPQEKQHRVLWVDRYTHPDGSTPDLDGLLEAAKKDGGIDGGAKTLYVRPLYTTPPAAQRTWVGLTATDWNAIAYTKEFCAGAEWAEAKLKEKNHG